MPLETLSRRAIFQNWRTRFLSDWRLADETTPVEMNNLVVARREKTHYDHIQAISGQPIRSDIQAGRMVLSFHEFRIPNPIGTPLPIQAQ